jgi:hypothetical protein
MSRRRVAVLVAIMAALAGAPSSVFGAAPNELSHASVSPASGDTETLFLVTVRYRSPAGRPALTVTAEVGGTVTLLTLASGTATDGVWSGTTTLPPGSWNVTLYAAVAKGPQPSLTAGTIEVAVTGDPSPSGDGIPSVGPDTGTGTGGGGATAAPAPAVTPPASHAPSQAPARSSNDATPSQPPTGQAQGGVALVRPGRGGAAPVRTPRPEPAGSDDGSPQSPAASPTMDGGPGPVGGGDDLGLLMIMGTLAVGVVALVGSAWVVVAGRRERRAATVTTDAAQTDPGVLAATIVEQRARRRARLRSSDDPILAAMGLPDEDATRGAPPAAPRPRTRTGRSRRRKPPAP